MNAIRKYVRVSVYVARAILSGLVIGNVINAFLFSNINV